MPDNAYTERVANIQAQADQARNSTERLKLAWEIVQKGRRDIPDGSDSVDSYLEALRKAYQHIDETASY